MKTIKYLALTFGILFLLAGCQWGETDEPSEDMVQIFEPAANATVPSPFAVKGEAPGTWFFEAQLSLSLEDEQGNLIAQAGGQSGADWMTEEVIPFSGTLSYNVTEDQEGTLVIERANPSGLPEYEGRVERTVFLVAQEGLGEVEERIEHGNLGVSIEVPNNFIEEIDEDEQWRILFIGPTQTPVIHVDGIVIAFQLRTNVSGNTLEEQAQFVFEQTAELEQTQEVSEALEATLIGVNVQAYTFTHMGVGVEGVEFRQYLFWNEDEELIQLSVMVEDPENAGYENTVAAILNSLELE